MNGILKLALKKARLLYLETTSTEHITINFEYTKIKKSEH